MKRTPFYSFAKRFLQPIIQPFLPCEFYGAENIPAHGAVILCCNHLGMSDALRLAFPTKRQVYYMAKAELFDKSHWPLSVVLKLVGAFPVQRGKRDAGAIDHGAEILNTGDIMGIFIEGHRSGDGTLGQPKSGAAMLSHLNNIPILPACITPIKGDLLKLFRRVYVSFGEVILPEELGVTQGTGSEYRAASRFIMGRIKNLREADLMRKAGK